MSQLRPSLGPRRRERCPFCWRELGLTARGRFPRHRVTNRAKMSPARRSSAIWCGMSGERPFEEPTPYIARAERGA